MSDPTLFDDVVPRPPSAHARRSDPHTSEQTQASLGRDGSMRRLIWEVATHWMGMPYREPGNCLNDTLLTELLELRTARRHQRNVVARCRDLMTDEGWFIKVGVFSFDGRELIHYIPNPQGASNAEVQRPVQA